MSVNRNTSVASYAVLFFAWSCGGTDSIGPPVNQPVTLLLTAAPNPVTVPTDIVLIATLSGGTSTTAGRVEFYEKTIGVDEAPRMIADVTEFPFTFRRSVFGPIDNGAREYTAKAFAGTTETASSDVIRVDVAVPDNVPLTARYFYTHARVTTPGAIGFRVEGNKVLARVEVYSGEKKVAEGAPPPGTASYFIFVPVSAADNGRQEYVVKAYDAAGAVVQSVPIPCVVDILWTLFQNVGAFRSEWETTFIASDATGSIYYAGTTESLDVFLVKYDPDGHQLWTRTFGGPDNEYGRSLSVDASGRVYVGGVISYTIQGVFTIQCFLNVYDASGSLVTSKQIKTASMDNASSCTTASDASGNVYVSGYTKGAGRAWPFVLKYDPDGNELWNREISATPVPGSQTSHIELGEIAVDRVNGGVYVGGYTAATFDGARSGPLDLFVLKFDADGTQVWARQYGTAGVLTIGRRLTADPNGGVYIAGETQVPNEGFSHLNALIASYGPDGTRRWVKTLNGGWGEVGRDVAVDSRGVYLIGFTTGRASLAGGLEITENSQGGSDLFVAKFSVAGDLLSVRLLGTPAADGGDSILIGLNGDIYAAGGTGFNQPDFVSAPFLARYRDAP